MLHPFVGVDSSIPFLSPIVIIANFNALLEFWPWQAGLLRLTMDAAYLQSMVQPALETDPGTPPAAVSRMSGT